jgi:hypothetical protein
MIVILSHTDGDRFVDRVPVFPLEKPRATGFFSEKNSGALQREARLPEFPKKMSVARIRLFAGRVSLVLSLRKESKIL